MKYYLAKVTPDEIEFMGMDGMCIAPDGTAYWYDLNFDGETISITDGCGHSVPIDYTAVNDFAQVFLNIQNYIEAKVNREAELLGILSARYHSER